MFSHSSNCTDIQQDHERHRVIGVDYPGLVPRPGKSVRGTLVENLTLQDVIRLDAFEGDVDSGNVRNTADGRNTKEEMSL